ncbi:unnamed protein product [Prunus armeniaca]|uniref:Endosulphine n=1 Tax=Prunus armeniaca TaxID=36596 RepID=A0A6J5W140_PRUAR|nr:hypothetical protein GBA52_002894 [Prunus armeniaca]CAB4295269.1 unnamed protein product [Prunus armeniaca]
MSDTNTEEVKEPELADSAPKDQGAGDNADSAPKDQGAGDNAAEDLKASNENHENPMPSPQQEEATIKKKYGGILPRKPPLISKDHERAYFDSADWALGKQGAKPKGPLEALRPKLQPTPQQQARSRRSSYSRAGDGDDGGNDNTSLEDQVDGGSSNTTDEDQSRHHE